MGLELEKIKQLLALDKAPQVTRQPPDNFDKAAEFLLELRFDNLYDPVARSEWWFSCRGCGDLTKRVDRESHWQKHRREFGMV